MTIKISIVMPAHNEESTIVGAIQSIIAQTLADWELIVINDASTDDTLELINKFIKIDSRIMVITNDVQLGLPASLNLAIKNASGDLIARADADDINLPTRLEAQYEFMKNNPQIDIVGSGAYLVNMQGKITREVNLPATHDELVQQPFLKSIFFHPSVCIRKRFFDTAGYYDETFMRAQDKELWLRGLHKGSRYANLQIPLIEYRTNGYIRTWRSILHRAISLFRIADSYKVKHGYWLVLKSISYSVLIKLRIYNAGID